MSSSPDGANDQLGDLDQVTESPKTSVSLLLNFLLLTISQGCYEDETMHKKGDANGSDYYYY